jgi:NADPH:quinone reductase-like Zn-dependent oxidoreductase
MSFLMVFVPGLLSCKMIASRKRDIEYSFLFVHPDGSQLAEIGELLEVGSIRPVIGKVFPFDQAKEVPASCQEEPVQGESRCTDQVKRLPC